jgi:hypothetical protein
MLVVSVDAKAIPIVHSENVSTLISDSGITRYRLDAKVWDIFSNDPEPYWYFPETVYVERFDSLLNVEGSLRADTGYYYEKKELWRVIGNVKVVNLEGSTFETSELFWNQRAPFNSLDAIYTDKSVKITQANGNIQYGRKGFRANQTLSLVRLYAFGGEFYAEEAADNVPQQHIQQDSTQKP